MDGQGNATVQKWARGLGWFSIALGVAEVLTPELMAAIIGTSGRRKTCKVLRFYGARELAAGIGILSSQKAGGWLWARVAGDALDLTTLLKMYGSRDNQKAKLTFAVLSVAGVAAADVWCARELSGPAEDSNSGLQQQVQTASA